MRHTAIEGFLIQYDSSLCLLRAEWTAGRRMALLRPALTQLQQLALRLQATCVLLDIDGMADLSVYDQIWLGTYWMPTVLQLPLQHVVVVIGSGRVYNLQAIEMLLSAFRLFIKFDLQFFTQVVPGLQWLTNGSPRLPQLLADWQAAYGPASAPSENVVEPRSAHYPD